MTRVRPQMIIGAAAVVVVLAIGTTVLANASWLPWNLPPAPCDLPSSVPTGPAAEASGIRVTEQGFTQLAHGPVSVGAMFWNAGKRIAYRTQVSFQPLDSDQRPLDPPAVVEVPVLLPGQYVGIGQDIWPTAAADATSVRVVPTTTYWLPAGTLGSYQPVTATKPRTSHPDSAFPGLVDIHYTDTSTNCGALAEGEASAIYRDATGRVVGGAADFPGSMIVYKDLHEKVIGGERHPPLAEACQPGTRDMWITPDSDQPATADPSRTTIYPNCVVPY